MGSMRVDWASIPLVLPAQKVGTRLHALVRRLTAATFAVAGGSLSLLFVLTWLYPISSDAPAWATISAGLGIMAAVALAAAALLAQGMCWIGPLGRGQLTVGPEGVLARGLRTQWIPRADIDAAWILREGDRCQVELRLKNGDVFSAVTTPEEATAVLDAVGVDASRRALRMPLGSVATNLGIGLAAAFPASCVSAMLGGATVGVIPMPSAALGFLIIALFVALIVGAVRFVAPPTVAVGSDGLAVGTGRGAWFAAFDTIRAVEVRRADLTLHLHDGRLRRISTLGTQEARRRALYERIVAGLAAAQAPRDLSARLGALDRNGRTVEAWRAALTELAAARDGYRQTGLTREEVRAALEDPRSTPERRIGATFVLAAMDAPLAGSRVRIVAETVAHEPVRRALEQAAAGEMDEDVLDAVQAAQTRG